MGGGVAMPGSSPMVEVMQVTGGGLESSHGGAGRVIRAPASKGGICPRCRGKCAARRGAEWSAPGQPERPLPLGLFLREREWGKENVGARPLLKTLPAGAQSTSPRRAKRRGSSGDRRMSLCAPSKHLPTHVRLSSPHSVSAVHRGSSSTDNGE